jgi:hypothetical protein
MYIQSIHLCQEKSSKFQTNKKRPYHPRCLYTSTCKTKQKKGREGATCNTTHPHPLQPLPNQKPNDDESKSRHKMPHPPATHTWSCPTHSKHASLPTRPPAWPAYLSASLVDLPSPAVDLTRFSGRLNPALRLSGRLPSRPRHRTRSFLPGRPNSLPQQARIHHAP